MADGMHEIYSAEVRWSDTRSEFAKAMCKAQQELGTVAKNSTNPHFKSKYADLASVLDAVLPPLNDAGFSLIQSPSGDDAGNVTVTTTLLHESGEWMESALKLRPVKTDPQGAGSAITYARRYAALAIAGAAPEDDDGNAASQRQSKAKSRDTFQRLQDGAREAAEMGETALTTWYRANQHTIKEMHEDFEQNLMDVLRLLRTEAQEADKISQIENEEADRAAAAMAAE